MTSSCIHSVIIRAAGPCSRVVCRSSRILPLRRPTLRAPKTHPATGLPLSKRKGQHILHNRGVIDKILDAAEINPSDGVYEVGCGTGELTMHLLPQARMVHTIDLEPRMVQETQHRASSAGFSNLEVSVGDALRRPMPKRFDVCVSNLPYQISSPFIFQLLKRLSRGPPWRSAILMVQREFADRLISDPTERTFSRLSINVRLFARVVRLFDVKPGSFIPEPQVHSTVVKLEPRLPAPDVDFVEWDAFIRQIFSRRRKMLRTHFRKLSTLCMLEQNYKMRCSLIGSKPSMTPFPDLVAGVLKAEGFEFERSFAMDVDDIHSLLKAFNRAGIYFASVHGGRSQSGAQLLDDGDDEDDCTELSPLQLLRPGQQLIGSDAHPPLPLGTPLGRGGLAYP